MISIREYLGCEEPNGWMAAPVWKGRVWTFTSDNDTDCLTGANNPGGGGAGSSAVLDTVHGGALQLLAAATTDNSGYNWISDAQYVVLGLGAKVRFKCRCNPSESTSTNCAAQSDWFIGLTPADAAVIASQPDNQVGFLKSDGSATLQFIVRGAAANAELFSVATTADDVVGTYAFEIEMDPVTAAKGVLTVWADGLPVVVRKVVTGFPLEAIVTSPTVEFISGDATGTKWMNLYDMGIAVA